MTTGGDATRRVRLFCALDLPAEVSEALANWSQRQAAAEPGLRPARREALHVTLCFLGHVAAEAVAEIGAITLEREPRPVELQLAREPLGIPPRRARLIAAGAESEAASGLQAELAARLAEAGHYKPEQRTFWPHVTLGRMRPERRGSRRPARLEAPLAALPDAVLEPFHAVRATLYRSHLRPAGAVYEPLAGLELPAAGTQAKARQSGTPTKR